MTIKKIVIADTHPIFLIGLQSIILNTSAHAFEICGQADKVPDLLQIIDETRPDIVVANLSLPEGKYSGIPFIRYLKKTYTTIRIVVVTHNNAPALVHILLACGVYCVISKQGSLKDIEQCLSNLSLNVPSSISPPNNSLLLSPKEAEVLHLLSTGHTINSIALMLNRTKQTISAQKINAMNKIGVSSDSDFYDYLRLTFM